jgi:hypothetical protein
MLNEFRGYYKLSDEEFKDLWEDCLFTFDANILLNVYRYSSTSRNRLFEILENLKDRIWIPYQVAFEYQENRLEVISNQLSPYKEIDELLDEQIKNLDKKINTYKKRHSFSDFVDTDQILKIIKNACEKVKKMLIDAESRYPNLIDNDIFREKLTELFKDKVCKKYSPENLEKIYKEAEIRYKKSIPPGYKDEKDKNPPLCYGDFIIWKQLIDLSKSQKKSIVFVTDDDKEDWWLKNKGRTIGPRPELIQEMFLESGLQFYMYTGDRFLSYSEKFLKLPLEPEVIQEAKDVRNNRIFGTVLSAPATASGHLSSLNLIQNNRPFLDEIARFVSQSYDPKIRLKNFGSISENIRANLALDEAIEAVGQSLIQSNIELKNLEKLRMAVKNSNTSLNVNYEENQSELQQDDSYPSK